MAARIIPNQLEGSTDWTSEIESKNILKKGFFNIAFSNMYNTSKPVILAGSSIDLDGIIHIFDDDESISGTITTGKWFVVISASGVPSFTNTTPLDYDDDKKGYYNVDGGRYVMGFDAGTTTYSNKFIMDRSYIDTVFNITKDLNVTGKTVTSTVNTGQGDNELYEMDQNVKTTDALVFSSVKTDNAFLKQKVFTGSLDSSGDATFSHGLNRDKIRGVSFMNYNASSDIWRASGGSCVIYPTTINLTGDSSTTLYSVVVTYEP